MGFGVFTMIPMWGGGQFPLAIQIHFKISGHYTYLKAMKNPPEPPMPGCQVHDNVHVVLYYGKPHWW